MAASKVADVAKTAASFGVKGLVQLKNKVASQNFKKDGADYYKQLLKENKEYIQDPPTIQNCQLLANQLFFTRLASIPARYEAFWKELDMLKSHMNHVMKNRQEWKVEKAGIVALFGVECYAWLCAGEIIGRGFTFFGYRV